jgi:ABC-type dipeptide/oligopeptide/nickel transport system permease component
LLTLDSSVSEARRDADKWRDFWELHAGEYSVLDGPRRLTASFAETQYGKWLTDVLRGGLGRTRAGQTALSLIAGTLPTTLLLLLVGLGGGFSLAVAWARFERRTSALASRYASAIGGTALAAVPCATFVRLLSGSGAGYVSAACLVTLTTAAWVSRHLSRSSLSAGQIAPIAAGFSVSAPLGATYPPFVLSAIVLVELAFQLPGLGGIAARALRTGDVNAWMAASLALALATLLLRQLAELLRPRMITRSLASQP